MSALPSNHNSDEGDSVHIPRWNATIEDELPHWMTEFQARMETQSDDEDLPSRNSIDVPSAPLLTLKEDPLTLKAAHPLHRQRNEASQHHQQYLRGDRGAKLLLALFLTVSALIVILTSTVSHRLLPPLEVPIVPHGTHWKGFRSIKNWFVFGDSWSAIKYCPAALIAPCPPTIENTFGNETEIAARAYGNWVQYLTLRYNHSNIRTRNLAWPGATINTVELFGFSTWDDLNHEVYEKFVPHFGPNSSSHDIPENQREWSADDTLFSFFFGINDVIAYIDRNKTSWEPIFKSYENLIGDMYNVGARSFLIINVPPLFLGPLSQHPGLTYRTLEDAIYGFNNHLASMVQNLRMKYTDVTIFDFNLYNLFDHVVEQPWKFPQTSSYKQTKTVCVEYDHLPAWTLPEPGQVQKCKGLGLDNYLWANDLHVTWPVHDAMAAAVEKFLVKNDPEALKIGEGGTND